jgi:uncharacterized protein YndB with AHSA1/START domain
MSGMPKAEVSLPDERSVQVVRRFRAPRALVWDAHTKPELVRRWMLGPPGWTMPVCEMDVRVGGRYRWRWRSDEDGKEFGFHGRFTEVVPHERLAHVEYVGGEMGDGARVTLTLTEAEGITTLTSLMDFGSQAARDAALATGMTDGMEQSYRQLDELAAQPAAR